MAWSLTKWFRGLYTQIVVNEQLDNNTVRALASQSYRGFGHADLPDSNNVIPPTTADGSPSGFMQNRNNRFYGRLPSQGDWFSPPPNPPGNQSAKN